MNREEKIKLLSAIAKGEKPEQELWIIHPTENCILARVGDRGGYKSIQPDEVADYVKQMQQHYPLHTITVHTITLEEWMKFEEEFEAEY